FAAGGRRPRATSSSGSNAGRPRVPRVGPRVQGRIGTRTAGRGAPRRDVRCRVVRGRATPLAPAHEGRRDQRTTGRRFEPPPSATFASTRTRPSTNSFFGYAEFGSLCE